MPGPLSTLTDDQLWNLQLAIQMLCNRGHFSFRKGREKSLCFGATALKLESDLRGVPAPAPPYHTNQFRAGAL